MQPPPSDGSPAPPLNRRGVLLAAIYGFISLIAAGFGLPAFIYFFLPPAARQRSPWVDVTDLQELEPGIPKEVVYRRNNLDGWKISSERATSWIVRQADGAVVAFSPSCTHLGCAYHWEAAKQEFVCPCHGSFFAHDGKVLGGPAPRPLDQYEVKIEGNQVWLGPIRGATEGQS